MLAQMERNNYSIKLSSLINVQQDSTLCDVAADEQGSILNLGKSAGFDFIQGLWRYMIKAFQMNKNKL